ncbi:hypothetical protein TNCV_4295691 [Trichonephila clavipes]|nr:hypothetical protein TNCV_4295691 [Trichonephila clavipes]
MLMAWEQDTVLPLIIPADWDKFTRQAVITEELVLSREVHDAVLNVTDAVMKAANAEIPKASSSHRKLCKPWWNSACYQAKKKQRRAWDIFRKYPTTVN